MKLYYNAKLDLLGISDTGWDMVATAKFIPILSKLAKEFAAKTDYVVGFDEEWSETLTEVMVENALPFTDDWIEVGPF